MKSVHLAGFFTAVLLFGFLFGSVASAAPTIDDRTAASPTESAPTAAAPRAGGGGCAQQTFFSLPTWYRYLGTKPVQVNIGGETVTVCEPKFTLMKAGKFDGTSLLLLALGIIDILIRLAALIAVFFVIYGGFRYMTSQGSPEATKGAQSTIINALIGLVVAILAASIVSFIGFSIG